MTAASSLAGLDHVRIDGALCQIVDLADLLTNLLAHLLKRTRMNCAPMALRFLSSGSVRPLSAENASSSFMRIRLMSHWESCLNLITLVLAHQTVVYEYAGQLIATPQPAGAGYCNRESNATGQSQRDPVLTTFSRMALMELFL